MEGIAVNSENNIEIPQIGIQLVELGYASPEEMAAALYYQEQHGGLLRDALVELNVASKDDLDVFFRGNTVSLSGDRMVRQGLITADELMTVLAYQAENGGRLGNAIVALGYASQAEVDEFFEKDQAQSKMMLGERLVFNGTITQEQLDKALEMQKSSGGALGEVLVFLGFATEDEIYDQLSSQIGIGRTGTKSNFEFSKLLSYNTASKYKAVIINARKDAYILAVQDPLDKEAIAAIEEELDKPVEQVLATMVEINRYWEEVYQDEDLDDSIYRLSRDQPENSAMETLSKSQLVIGILALFTFFVALFLDFESTLLTFNIVCQIIYLVLTVLKAMLLYRGHKERSQLRYTPEEVAALDERTLPIYTILVPVYKEAGIAPLLVERLNALDYPQHKLDIRVLLEADDEETIEAFRSANLPSHYTLLVVPDTQPRTKPKACNYGLLRARGEYVVIYDAEDMPEPDQLKKTILAFRELPDDYACVQAKLNYYNNSQNLITRWFTHEYGTWFDVLLVGIMSYNAPIPLGGTSNHLKTEAIREIGAWDPFNVTEDADLGIRLHKKKYRTAVVDSYTFEEANSQFGNWIRQRSRWLKGYLQTWLVNMRHPLKLYKELGGFTDFLFYQGMILGTPLIPLLNPFFWVLMVIWYGFEPGWLHGLFPGALYYIASAQFLIGNFLFVFSNLVGSYTVIREGEERGTMHLGYNLILSGALLPIYWIMMSIAAWKGFLQLIFKPHYWEKTEHGLTTQTTQESLFAEDFEDSATGTESGSVQENRETHTNTPENSKTGGQT